MTFAREGRHPVRLDPAEGAVRLDQPVLGRVRTRLRRIERRVPCRADAWKIRRVHELEDLLVRALVPRHPEDLGGAVVVGRGAGGRVVVPPAQVSGVEGLLALPREASRWIRALRCIPASTLTPMLATTQMICRIIAPWSWTSNLPKKKFTSNSEANVERRPGPVPPSAAETTTAG